MTYAEAKQELAMMLDIDYTDIANNQLFTDDDLGRYVKAGLLKAWDYKPWDFKEGAKEITSIDTTYYDYPTDFVSGSIYFLTVDGKEYKKLRHQDYLKAFDDDPATLEEYWSKYKRFFFVNKAVCTPGKTISVFGLLKAPVLVNTTDLLPFSPDTDNEEYSGNSAIVKLAYAEALISEKLNNQAKAKQIKADAYEILGLLWIPMAEDKGTEQSLNRPFFDVPDFFSGSGGGGNNSVIGKF
jgi:hypothetical protein